MSATPVLKPVSISNGCPNPLPSPFTRNNCCPVLASFTSAPFRSVKLQFFCSSPPIPSWVSLKKNALTRNGVGFVARTSDWAQQEEEKQVVEDEGFDWEKQSGDVGAVEAEAQASDWEGEQEEQSGAEDEGESGGDGFMEETYPEPPEEAKLFVGNLPYDMDSNKLAELFDKAGIVEVAEVIYNRETDQSRGFGFVTMSTVEEAEKAVETLHRYDVNGRLLTVNKAAPRGSRLERPRESGPSLRIYVGNLPWQVNDARLEQVFSEHGKVVDARVVYDRETGRSRGFGFVTMSTQTELDDAIAALDGQNLDGRAIRVNVAEERPRRNSF